MNTLRLWTCSALSILVLFGSVELQAQSASLDTAPPARAKTRVALSSLTPEQAKAHFALAALNSEGFMGDLAIKAVLMPNSDPASQSLELWRKTAQGFTLLALAPKAGCADCSGPTHKNNPTRVWFSDNALHVEYQGGGSGLGFWAWRSSWGWDASLSQIRSIATQRIGADQEGSARHAMVNFIEGSRYERLRVDGSVKTSACTASIALPPRFAELSLGALFDGALEPDCLHGTVTGDPLANSPTPSGGALDNLMRSSKTTAR